MPNTVITYTASVDKESLTNISFCVFEEFLNNSKYLKFLDRNPLINQTNSEVDKEKTSTIYSPPLFPLNFTPSIKVSRKAIKTQKIRK